MKFLKQTSALPQFHMTAMMDVIFLLLCFFITSTVFSQWEYEVDIELPTAKSARTQTRSPGEIIVNVSQSGEVSINQRVFSGEELTKLLQQVAMYLPGQPVIVRADKGTRYEDLMQVVDACRQVGIAHLALATADSKEPVVEESITQ